MEELPKPPELLARGGIWFRSGDVFVHLGVDGEFHPARKAHPAFRCIDYDALLQRLRSRGITAFSEKGLLEGRAHCYISDPFGNRIELVKEAASQLVG